MTKNPLAGLAALGLGGLAPANTGGLNPAGKVIEIIYFVSVKYNYLLTLQVFNNIFTVFRYFVVPRLQAFFTRNSNHEDHSKVGLQTKSLDNLPNDNKSK